MKTESNLNLLRLLAVPVLTVLLGLILLFSPDTASALVGKLIAWGCLLTGGVLGIGILRGGTAHGKNRILWAAICLVAGVWMLLNPLTIARFLGRVLGITLMIRGGKITADHMRYDNGKFIVSRGLISGAAMLIFGGVLVVLPMATSRMVFNLLGVVLICVGIAQGADKIRGRKQLEEGGDPNIIDVEKL